MQLYTVRTDLEKDFAGTLAKVAAIGYKEVEFAEHDRPHVRRGKGAEVMPEKRYERPVRLPTLELTMINPHLRDQLGDTQSAVAPPRAFGCIDTARI